MREQTYRVVILSDLGNTLIDVSIAPQQTDIHYILEDLNRKMNLKTLANDFRILLQTAQPAEQQCKNDQETIYRADKLYYFYSDTELLKKIVLIKNSKEKIIFEF